MCHPYRKQMYHLQRNEMYHSYRNEIIREFIKGTSKRKISEILNLSRTSIDVYLG